LNVDEPGKNTIEILNNENTFPSSTGTKHKRNQLFPDTSNSCCPTVVELIEPLGGKNRSGRVEFLLLNVIFACKLHPT